MKLEKISVINWRGKNFNVEPKTRNYLFHENGYGKTSLMDAIRYGISGALPDDSVTDCSVEISEGETGLTFSRTRTNNGTVCKLGGLSGKKIPEKSLNEKIENACGISNENIRIASSSDVFGHMKPDEFLALLIQYIPDQLTYRMVTGYISGFTDEHDDLLQMYLPDENFGIAEIDACAKELNEGRLNLKRSVSQNKNIIKSLPSDGSGRTLEEIESDLIDIQMAERDSADFDRKIKAYNEALAKKQDQDERVRKTEEWLTEHQADDPDPEKFARISKDKADALEMKAESSKTLGELTQSIASIEKSLKGLGTSACPLSEKLVCKTDKSGVKDELTKTLEKNRESVKRLGEMIKKCDERAAKADEEAAAYNKNIKEYKRREQCIAFVKNAKVNPVAVPEKPLDLRKIDVKAKKEALIKEKEAAVGIIQRKKLERKIDDDEASIVLYSDLINAMSDRGSVKKGIISHYAQLFQDAANAQTEFFKGFEINFVADNGIKVFAKTPANQEAVYYESLSSGEKIVVTFLIVDMLNQLSGMRMAFIDNIEQLDSSAMKQLHAVLSNQDFLAGYDHIFVCGVNNKDVMGTFGKDMKDCDDVLAI